MPRKRALKTPELSTGVMISSEGRSISDEELKAMLGLLHVKARLQRAKEALNSIEKRADAAAQRVKDAEERMHKLRSAFYKLRTEWNEWQAHHKKTSKNK